MPCLDISFSTGGIYSPEMVVHPFDNDTLSLVKAFAVFMRYFGEDFTVSHEDGAYILCGSTTDKLEDEDYAYEGAFGVLEEAGLMASPPTEEPSVPRDTRTGLAIPAPGFPWTDTKGPVSLKEPKFKAGDLVELTVDAGLYDIGHHFKVSRIDKDGDIRDPDDCCFHPHELRKVLEEPVKEPTEFKQGDLVKVVRVTHDDDSEVLDRVGSVIGVDSTHTNGQTVYASFWDLDKGEDKPWWVHKDSLDLVYRPGSSS